MDRHGDKLLAWYDQHGRDLPWRVKGAHPSPYHVWLSEIMLQQTVVKTVIPYFETFLQEWPSLFELADCDLEEVLKRWAGLGYYARARNLHACAKVLVRDHEGIFPRDEKQLLALPGIGPYTAAAIRAIAFDQRAVVVDGNVERVTARLFAIKKPLPEIKALLKEKAAELTPEKRPGDYAQAMMDLGATICTPKRPACSHCPISTNCLALARDCAQALPVRAKKKPKPVRTGTAFLVLREDGAILLRQRPGKGLLAKMLEVPATDWDVKPVNGKPAEPVQSAAPVQVDWQIIDGLVSHTFTHFHLQLEVWLAHTPINTPLLTSAAPERCRWLAHSELAHAALPGVMRKIISHGLGRSLSSKA